MKGHIQLPGGVEEVVEGEPPSQVARGRGRAGLYRALSEKGGVNRIRLLVLAVTVLKRPSFHLPWL